MKRWLSVLMVYFLSFQACTVNAARGGGACFPLFDGEQGYLSGNPVGSLDNVEQDRKDATILMAISFGIACTIGLLMWLSSQSEGPSSTVAPLGTSTDGPSTHDYLNSLKELARETLSTTGAFIPIPPVKTINSTRTVITRTKIAALYITNNFLKFIMLFNLNFRSTFAPS